MMQTNIDPHACASLVCYAALVQWLIPNVRSPEPGDRRRDCEFWKFLAFILSPNF